MADTYSREQIKFTQLTQARYDGYVQAKTIDAYTIYFTTDTHKIYKGSAQYAINVQVGNYTLSGLQDANNVYANYMYISNTGKIFYCTAVKSGEEGSKNAIIAIGDQDTITAEIDGMLAIVGTPVANKIVTVDADGEFQYSNAITTSVDAVGVDTNVPTEKAVRTAIDTAMSSANAYTDTASSTLSAFVGSSIDTAMGSASAYASGLVNSLDLAAVGGNSNGINSVVATVSQTDGQVSATAIDLIASNVGRSSTSAISSLTVQGALVELKGAIDASTAAQKTYTINALAAEAVALLGTNVKQAYQLVDEDGATAGATIKIYKDSSLIKVYLGADGTTSEPVESEPNTDEVEQGQYLNFIYQLASGAYEVVGVDVSNFLAESQFADGLSVDGNGVVSVNLDANNQYVKFDAQGAIVDTGINNAIATALSSANAYTDTASSTLSAFVGSSVADAVSSANAYTDTASSTLSAFVGSSIADAASSASAYASGLVNSLDLTAVGGTGKVVTTVSQTDGQVSATAIDLIASNVGVSSVSGFSGSTVQGTLQQFANLLMWNVLD